MVKKQTESRLKVEAIKITDLSSDPSNLRLHSDRNIEAIKNSLARFGQQKPIVIDAKNIVHAGNGTLEAAKLLGWDSIDCIRSSLTGSDLTAFAIADNRTAELANWDDDALGLTLATLDGIDDSLLLDLAFTQDELKNLLPPADSLEESELPNLVSDPITKTGDVWKLGSHRLMCGDSTDRKQIKKLMGGTIADVLFTSPPYALGKSMNVRGNDALGNKSPYIEHDDGSAGWPDLMQGFFDASSEFVKECYIINVQSLAGNKRQLAKFIADNSEQLCDVALWDKSHGPPAMAAGVLNSQFEYLLIFSTKKNASRRVPLASWRGTLSNVHVGNMNNGNEFSEVHGATMPLHVPVWALDKLCDEARSVLDPFCGTGTTIIACEQLGRSCCSMEITPAYCDLTVERWQNVTGEKATRQ